MFRRLRNRRTAWCFAIAIALLAGVAQGQSNWTTAASSGNPYAGLVAQSAPSNSGPYPSTGAPPVVTEWPAQSAPSGMIPVEQYPGLSPSSANWIVPGDQQPGYVDAEVYCDGDTFPQQPLLVPDSGLWYWQLLPDGLIYRSYWAGVHEPRMALQWFSESDGRNLWDATLGGRAGLLRYGTGGTYLPQGWQLDIEGAAMVRLNLENNSDLDTGDYRFGVPLTYGIDNWQFKFGYYHLSSHLGDEKAIREPGSLAERINYVRDALLLGASYYPVPYLRLYGETAYSTNADGGAEPWEFQFGTELSKPGPTGFAGSPFLALNGHLRQEHDFGGDFTAQTGWLWRGNTGQTLRIGGHYFNGKSSQWQTFDDAEEQIGVGVWYDY